MQAINKANIIKLSENIVAHGSEMRPNDAVVEEPDPCGPHLYLPNMHVYLCVQNKQEIQEENQPQAKNVKRTSQVQNRKLAEVICAAPPPPSDSPAPPPQDFGLSYEYTYTHTAQDKTISALAADKSPLDKQLKAKTIFLGHPVTEPGGGARKVSCILKLAFFPSLPTHSVRCQFIELHVRSYMELCPFNTCGSV